MRKQLISKEMESDVFEEGGIVSSKFIVKKDKNKQRISLWYSIVYCTIRSLFALHCCYL